MKALINALALAAASTAPAMAQQAGPTPPAPTLNATQAGALRCGVAFAVGAKLQEAKSPVAIGWPALMPRGREFFVRVMAQLMDETGLSRETLTQYARANAATLRDPAAIDLAVTACLPQLKAAGL